MVRIDEILQYFLACNCCLNAENNGRRQVWLGRGAPNRWFQDPDGFGVGGPWPTSCGPTRCSASEIAQFVRLRDGGAIAYHVYTHPAGRRAMYNLTITKGSALPTGEVPPIDDKKAWFVLRWPQPLKEHSIIGDGCHIVQVEPLRGLVVVEPQFRGVNSVAATSCTVGGRW